MEGFQFAANHLGHMSKHVEVVQAEKKIELAAFHPENYLYHKVITLHVSFLFIQTFWKTLIFLDTTFC